MTSRVRSYQITNQIHSDILQSTSICVCVCVCVCVCCGNYAINTANYDDFHLLLVRVMRVSQTTLVSLCLLSVSLLGCLSVCLCVIIV